MLWEEVTPRRCSPQKPRNWFKDVRIDPDIDIATVCIDFINSKKFGKFNCNSVLLFSNAFS